MNFDPQKARQSLEQKEKEKQEALEKLRQEVLGQAQQALREKFGGSEVEVYLVGSVTQPYQFRLDSDVDVVLKNFDGDRFAVWTQLEDVLYRQVEVMLFEKIHFQDYVLSEGLKV